jgi:hypothetical protein
MKEILEPLDAIREVNPPYFLKDKIAAKVSAMKQRVSVTTLAFGGTTVAALFIVSVFIMTREINTQPGAQLAAGLYQENNLY